MPFRFSGVPKGTGPTTGAEAPYLEGSQGGPLSVLIAEEDPSFAKQLEQTLTEFGFRVVSNVVSGEEAIRKASETNPKVALIDTNLKGELDGLTAAAHLREVLNIPVVFITDAGDSATFDRAKATRPYGYLLKPFDDRSLRYALELAIGQHAFETSEKSSDRRKATPSSTQQVVVETLPEPKSSLSQAEVAHPTDSFFLTNAVFASLSAVSKDLLTSSLKSFEFKRGQDLPFGRSSTERQGFVVLRGSVSLVASSPSGKELIVEVVTPADITGLLFILGSHDIRLHARAQSDATVAPLSSAFLQRVFEASPRSHSVLIEQLSGALIRGFELARNLAHERAEARLLRTLEYLVKKIGIKGVKDQSATVVITRSELADMAGITLETCSRLTTILALEETLITPEPGTVKVLDTEKLKRLAAES